MAKVIVLKMLIVLGIVFVVSCAASSPMPVDDKRVSERTQQNVMDRAITAEPAYVPNRFPARQMINRYLRQTEELGEWYTYALNMEGVPIFYVLSDYKPMNICISITAPDRRVYSSSGSVVMSSPALDGVYYGGAGCSAYYLFDVTTGGMIEIAGGMFTLISSQTPLFLETDIVRLQPAE